MKTRSRKLAAAAVGTALVTAATMLLYVPLPAAKGYCNGGEIVIFSLAYLVGGIPAIIAAALGSAIADLALGFVIYSPFTAVIKGLEAYVTILLFRRAERRGAKDYTLCALPGAVIMVAGYFLTECALFGTAMAVAGAPANAIQALVGVVAAGLFIRAARTEGFRRAMEITGIREYTAKHISAEPKGEDTKTETATKPEGEDESRDKTEDDCK